MRRFVYRLVTLGLLLCVVHVWSDTICGSRFTDIASSALRADIIVEGKPRRLPDTDFYNVTVQVRSVKKGAELLNRGKKPKLITVGTFGKENKHDCIGEVVAKRKYIFFLRTPSEGSKKYLQISALPVKSQKRTNRQIKKIICDKCAKAPAIRKIRKKDVKEGSSFKLKCSAKAKPNPSFQWFKDGVPLKTKKGTLRIKDGRKSSRLQIIKADKKDAGQYVCQAANVEGQANVTVRVAVTARRSELKHQRCKEQTFCLNGGTCRYMASLNKEFCECPEKWAGPRCQLQDLFSLGPEYNRQARLLHDRTIIFISIAIAALVFIAICIISYFLARHQRKKWEARKMNKRNKNIPETYRLLDDVDGRNTRPLTHRVRETCTQTDFDRPPNYPNYNDPNEYPIINPYHHTPAYEPEVEMRRQAMPLGSAPPRPGSNQSGAQPERVSRASSRGSRSRLKAMSQDDDDMPYDNDQPGMNDRNCIPMKVLPRNCYSDSNIKGGVRPGGRQAPPTSMQNMDIPEGDLEEVKPLNAEAPVVIDLRSPTSLQSPIDEPDSVRSNEGASSGEASQLTPKYLGSPDVEFDRPYSSVDLGTDSEMDATDQEDLPRLYISEGEEDSSKSGSAREPPRDKSLDSIAKSDSQPTMESVLSDGGLGDLRNDSDLQSPDNDLHHPDSDPSSSVTGSPDSHPSSSMENLIIPVLPNGTETGLSWDEHGMPVSPRHTSFPPFPSEDSQNLEDQFIHPQPPNDLPLSPSKNTAVYQKLLKDIREDQDAIPI